VSTPSDASQHLHWHVVNDLQRFVTKRIWLDF